MAAQPTLQDFLLILKAIRVTAETALETAGIQGYGADPLGDALIGIIELAQNITAPFQAPESGTTQSR